MVKFDIVYNRDLRQIVHKLGTLIEIGSVILVAFDDEVLTVSNAKTNAEVLRHAANQESRVQTTMIQQPGSDTCSCSLTVCAGNNERAAAANEFFFYDFSHTIQWCSLSLLRRTSARGTQTFQMPARR